MKRYLVSLSLHYLGLIRKNNVCQRALHRSMCHVGFGREAARKRKRGKGEVYLIPPPPPQRKHLFLLELPFDDIINIAAKRHLHYRLVFGRH